LTRFDARPRPRRGALALAALLTCAGAGCDLPANPRRPQVLTLADLEALVDPAMPNATFANDDGVPDGLLVRDYVKFEGGKYQLQLRDTWTEAYRSAYVTAELWTGFDEVWVQPVYVPITGVDPQGVPVKVADPLTGWSPIFSVGPDSSFYSPFWQVYYFQVSDLADAEAFKSARKVIDSGRPLIKGPARTMSIVPGDVALPKTAPMSDQMVGGPQAVGQGYLDGKDVSFLDFGVSTFSWNDDLVVEETPLFVLLYRDTDGNLKRMNVPTIAGTGPLYANRPPKLAGSVPHYGAFWRIYTVEVPPTARIFAPPLEEFKAARADYPPSLVAVDYGADIIAAGAQDVSQWLGRVALNAVASPDGTVKSCFDAYNNIDTRGPSNPTIPYCHWLDSQPSLEAAVPSTWIHKTDILVTCPFVSYDDMPFVVAP
jgi:hypothetical protein